MKRHNRHRTLVSVALTLSLTVAGPLQAQSVCQSNALDQIIKRYNDRCRVYEGCYAWHLAKVAAKSSAQMLVYPPAAFNTIKNEMTSWWNAMVGNTWARVGPRYVDFGTSVKGNVITPTKRTWYSLMPSTDDVRYVRIRHDDGRSRTIVRICTVDPTTGRPSQATAFDIPKGSSQQYWPANAAYQVNNAAGQFVIVEIDPKTVGRSFRYTLWVR